MKGEAVKLSASIAALLMQTWQEADEDVTVNQLMALWEDQLENVLHDLGMATDNYCSFSMDDHLKDDCPGPRVDFGAWFKCPACGIGQHQPEILLDYHTKLGGRPVIIKEARASKCNKCGETSVAALELERWEGLQREQELEARVSTLEATLEELSREYQKHAGLTHAEPDLR